MPRRVSLPGASELFRPTQPDESTQPAESTQPSADAEQVATARQPKASQVAGATDAPARASRTRTAPAGVAAHQDVLAGVGAEPAASGVGAASDDDDPADAGVASGPVARVPRARRAPVAPLSRPSASGRVRHDEKITVYVSADELMALEEARLSLRRAGIAVDRGRLVRAAIALAMADLAEFGDEGALVDHLLGS